MSKVNLLMASIVLLYWQGSTIEPVIADQATLLAGANKKAWYLYSQMPESLSKSCTSTNVMSLDNTYTFYKDGTFEFDHGAITNDSTCVGDDCCSDLVNIKGKWKFTNNKTNITVTATHEKGNEKNALKLVLFDGTIDQLDDMKFKISQKDTETNSKYFFEFRKR